MMAFAGAGTYLILLVVISCVPLRQSEGEAASASGGGGLVDSKGCKNTA